MLEFHSHDMKETLPGENVTKSFSIFARFLLFWGKTSNN